MMSDLELEGLEKTAQNAALGYNTGNLTSLYVKHVSLLLKEREELLAALAHLRGMIDQPTNLLMGSMTPGEVRVPRQVVEAREGVKKEQS